jgi:hypothetical protein
MKGYGMFFFLSLLLYLVYIDLVGYFTCHIFFARIFFFFFFLKTNELFFFSSYARKKGKSELLWKEMNEIVCQGIATSLNWIIFKQIDSYLLWWHCSLFFQPFSLFFLNNKITSVSIVGEEKKNDNIFVARNKYYLLQRKYFHEEEEV